MNPGRIVTEKWTRTHAYKGLSVTTGRQSGDWHESLWHGSLRGAMLSLCSRSEVAFPLQQARGGCRLWCLLCSFKRFSKNWQPPSAGQTNIVQMLTADSSGGCRGIHVWNALHLKLLKTTPASGLITHYTHYLLVCSSVCRRLALWQGPTIT